MAASGGRRFKVGPNITVQLHNKVFEEIRHTTRLETLLRVRGETWVSRLNTELNTAQVKRKQPTEDGYTFHISSHGSRLRLYILTFTARAFAHERKHSSILKLMETTKYETVMRGDLTPAQQMVAARAKAKSVAHARAAARGEKPTRKKKTPTKNALGQKKMTPAEFDRLLAKKRKDKDD